MMPMIRKTLLVVSLLVGCSDDSGTPPRSDTPVERGASDLGRPERPADHRVDLARVDLALDLPRADQGCVIQVAQLVAEADACLAGADGTGKYGTATICNIGTAINSVGVFRFDLGSIATSRIQSIKLTLAYAAADPACGGTCASCDGIEHAGTLVRTHMRSDWNEPSVTWAHRAYQDPTLGTAAWSASGASGPGDRSGNVAAIPHATKQSAVFDSATSPQMLAGLESWRAGNKISFQVLPTNGAVLIAAMREQPSSKCGTGYAKPALEVRSCP
jgi:hypothetical protein